VLALEAAHGVRSTWNVITRHGHSRDADYSIDDPQVRDLLDRLADTGHEVGVHGSYTSATTPGALAEEYGALAAIGHRATGGRQHWLRWNGAGLFDELVAAGATWDSSAGWPDRIGFRHGMATPFVPYDPVADRPVGIVEVPLIVMDVALDRLARGGVCIGEATERVLDEVRRHRGGVSVLWHDTVFGDTQVRPGIATLYRTLLERGDTWTTSSELVERWAARPVPATA
jgi:peptidoglycan/xylan/chitin deacetylase (PgdA/CDA1 family)